ncbi:MAG: hypothetical protein AAF363_10350 [Bacteroidota bacterium]
MRSIIVKGLIALFCFSATSIFAQKRFKTKGEAQVKIEDNMTKEGAREKAKQLAIVNAIEGVLGTYVEQETNIDIVDGETSFKIIGNTKVKGEWVKTSKEDFEEDTRVIDGETEIWITCNISGTVREIVKPKLAFETLSLNCPQKICRTTKYEDGESFYLHFRSPSTGYLSLYLVEQDETVYRLLPYQGMSDPYIDAVPVKADKEYIFFSNKDPHNYFSDFPLSQVDELGMYTDFDKEYLQLYVVFSTDKFSKPILDKEKVLQEGSLPKSLTAKRFEEWVEKNRIYNPDFNYDVINLEIVKR